MSYFENIGTFVRIYELGGMSAAARDQRISPAVVSARIAQLEAHLGVRLFQRNTRNLSPTEQGRIFYEGAGAILDAIEAAEASIGDVTDNPRGTLHVAAPLGVGRRLIAPHVPEFTKQYPLVNVRLRLTDRKLDLTAEGLDISFFLGRPEDSNLRIKKIADCERVLCASPAYIAEHGHPKTGMEIEKAKHNCLNLRYPGAKEFQWELKTKEGSRKFEVRGRFETDDGDVLTDWALAGTGIAMKPVFEVADHLKSGALVVVAEDTPPLPVQMACLYTHRRHQDPKARLFMEFMIDKMQGVFDTA